jgi:membrane protease YdiL (CAAX protease family)
MSVVRRHPLATYFILAFGLAWWTWPFVLVNPKSSPMLPWSPIIAAVIVLAITQGRAGVGRLLRSTFRWRVDPRWYAAALGIPLVLWLIAAAIPTALGATPNVAYFADFILFPITLLTTAVVKGPLTEEPGWRGFALPQMLGRWSPLLASLLLGFIWFVWHLPLLVQDPSGAQRPLVPYIVVVLSLSVLATWLWAATNRNVFIVVIFHAAVNSFGSHVVPAYAVADQLTIWWIFAGLIALSAVVAMSTEAFRRSAEPVTGRADAQPVISQPSAAVG